MKYIALVAKGTEDVAVKELQQLGAKTKKLDCKIEFETNDINNILYYANIPKKYFKKTDLKGYEGSFGVRAYAPEDQDIDKRKIESSVGSKINKATGMKVNLENPDHWFGTLNSELLGEEILHLDFDKKPYKVFNNPQSIKGSLAAAALYFAGYDKDQVLLDPFCRAGDIVIEAALIASKTSAWKYEKLPNIEMPTHDNPKPKPIYAYDELLPNITAGKKNAKIAGVEKLINFSRTDVSWLDTKFEENQIDLVVSMPALITKINKKAIKSLEEFFYQMEFILKPEGKIVFLTTMKEAEFVMASKYKFKILRQHKFWAGKQPYHIFEFHKS